MDITHSTKRNKTSRSPFTMLEGRRSLEASCKRRAADERPRGLPAVNIFLAGRSRLTKGLETGSSFNETRDERDILGRNRNARGGLVLNAESGAPQMAPKRSAAVVYHPLAAVHRRRWGRLSRSRSRQAQANRKREGDERSTMPLLAPGEIGASAPATRDAVVNAKAARNGHGRGSRRGRRAASRRFDPVGRGSETRVGKRRVTHIKYYKV